MRIGVPTEIKTLEGRVALVPPAAGVLVQEGHRVFVQQGAGLASGYGDDEYRQAGVELVETAEELYGSAELLVKVKEPLPPEYALLRPDHLLFCYLHLAAIPELARFLCERGLTAVGWETVEEAGGLPLLQPMSAVAGRLAVQLASNLLYRPADGRGLLLGGLAGAERGRVLVLGGGTVGSHAAQVAAALGAEVTVLARRPGQLQAAQALGPNVSALPAFPAVIEAAAIEADVLVGAVLVPGGRAPVLISEALVGRMRPGSVIVDVSVDQGGCVATTRPTLWDDPTYQAHGVNHFAVTNMPGAVPRSSSQVLSTALVPYLRRLAAPGGLDDAALASGINVRAGEVVHPQVHAALSNAAG